MQGIVFVTQRTVPILTNGRFLSDINSVQVLIRDVLIRSDA